MYWPDPLRYRRSQAGHIRLRTPPKRSRLGKMAAQTKNFLYKRGPPERFITSGRLLTPTREGKGLAWAQRILSKRAALGHTTDPPTRASNFSNVQNPAEKGSFCMVTALRLTTM